uniref:Uncharacterized protein n=1 Tax=Knipowitschia caucasica TaxID=637954 RepID=A0AAV2LAG3_KNICA
MTRYEAASADTSRRLYRALKQTQVAVPGLPPCSALDSRWGLRGVYRFALSPEACSGSCPPPLPASAAVDRARLEHDKVDTQHRAGKRWWLSVFRDFLWGLV